MQNQEIKIELTLNGKKVKVGHMFLESIVNNIPECKENKTKKNNLTNFIGKVYSFENFEINEKNKLAYKVCKNILTKKTKQLNPVFIYGKNLGKTHLLKALEHTCDDAYYTSISNFSKDYILSLREKKVFDFQESFDKYEVLLIDNFDDLSGKESTQNEIVNLIDNFSLSNKQIVITSEQPIESIAGISSKLKNRINCGMVVSI